MKLLKSGIWVLQILPNSGVYWLARSSGPDPLPTMPEKQRHAYWSACSESKGKRRQGRCLWSSLLGWSFKIPSLAFCCIGVGWLKAQCGIYPDLFGSLISVSPFFWVCCLVYPSAIVNVGYQPSRWICLGWKWSQGGWEVHTRKQFCFCFSKKRTGGLCVNPFWGFVWRCVCVCCWVTVTLQLSVLNSLNSAGCNSNTAILFPLSPGV